MQTNIMRVVRNFTFLCSLLICATAHSIPFTVAQDGSGDYTSIQAAIDAAVARGGANEVRVAAGHWHERVQIGTTFSGNLDLTGGWTKGFLVRSFDERQTILDGDGVAPILLIRTNNGRVSVSGFTFTGGNSYTNDPISGQITGAIYIESNLNAIVRIEDVRITDNHVALPALYADGVGIFALLHDDATLYFFNNTILNNSAIAQAGQTASGGGGYFALYDNSNAAIADNDFISNSLQATDDQTTGTALFVTTTDHAYISIRDNKITNNVSSTGPGAGTVGSVALWASGSSIIDARRSELRRNRGNYAYYDVSLLASEESNVYFTDSLVANSNNQGLNGIGLDTANMYITNNTFASNGGLSFSAAGSPDGPHVYVFNNLNWNNGTNRPTFVWVSDFANSWLNDPLFMDSPSGDYHVRFGSIAIDHGWNVPPEFGGLGPVDLDFQDRLQGVSVDVGAYEYSTRNTTDEGICRTLDFIPPMGARRSVPACRCISDNDLRINRCSFLLPDFVLIAAFPLDPKPSLPFETTWTIQTWNPNLVSQYSMAVDSQIDGEWIPQKWFGPSAKLLEPGVLVFEKFMIQPAKEGFTPIRTAIEYQRKDTKGKVRAVFEVLLPEVVVPPSKK